VPGRDRLLAALFALQLGVAAVLGGFLVSALNDDSRPTTLAQQPGQPAVQGPVPSTSASAAAAVPGAQGTKATTTTTTTGGTQGGGKVANPTGADTKVVPPGAPIKVGAVVSQTGAISFVSSAQATKAYFDMVNRKGGVNGHKIILDLRDDQLDSARGRQQTQQLIASGVFAFAGFNAPVTEPGIVPLLEQNKIPLIGGYGLQEEYHTPWAYIFSASYGHFGFQMGSYLAEQGVKKPGLVYINNNSAKANNGLVAAFKAGFKSKGVTLSDSEIVVVDVTKPSYDDVVTQFKLDQVDGMATLLDQTAYNRLNQAQDRQAYHPKHAASPLFVDPTVKQSSNTEGTFVASDFDFIEGGGPAIQEYVQTVKAAYGSRASINYFGQQGWIDAKIFVAALQKLGNTITRDALLKTMDSLDGKGGFGFSSDLRFGPGERDLNRCLKLAKVVQGKATRVTGWRCDEQPF
jgi:ABC-type branched-subunit amino acid transport system substrate-binding protein